jgi:hypothetical protein|tara:strand:+ start:612 stop:848 length:237 start_codon:yes stop_codon:yes gene_type:complete
MKLGQEEINAIARILDNKIGNTFHDACWSVMEERLLEGVNEFEVSDEDVMKIKLELALILLDSGVSSTLKESRYYEKQ